MGKIKENLHAEGILEALGPDLQTFKVQVVESTGSTQTDLKEAYADGKIQGPYLLTTTQQTAGRGRFNKKFESTIEEGLYTSFICQLDQKAVEKQLPLSIVCSLATVLAVEKQFSGRLDLKWINDIFYAGKKNGGILIERVNPATYIVGMGLNLYGHFQGDLAETAGTLFSSPDFSFDPNLFLANYLKAFFQVLATSPEENRRFYNDRLLGVGLWQTFLADGKLHEGKLRGIDASGDLVMEDRLGQGRAYKSSQLSLGSQRFTQNG